MDELKNHSLIKKINRAKILNAIRTESPVSRSRLAEKTFLDKKTLTNFVSEFLAENLVEVSGKLEQRHGRPFTMLRFTGRLKVCGVDIQPSRVGAVVTDLYGNVVDSLETDCPVSADREAILAAVDKIYAPLRKLHGPFHGVGVALPGILDESAGVITSSSTMPALVGMDLYLEFSRILGGPLFFEDNSRTKALLEKWFGLGRECADFVCVDIGEGIGSGMINGRRLYKGPGGHAGELGHVVIERGGAKCKCGNRGCLEAYASEDLVMDRINSILGTDLRNPEKIPDIPLPSELSDFVADIGCKIGMGLATVVNILNPTLIILHGRLVNRFRDILVPAVRRGVSENSLKECRDSMSLVASEPGLPDACGAAALVLADIFEVDGYYLV